MFHTLGISTEQVYGDVYASWLRDTHEKNGSDAKMLFRNMVEAGFLDRQIVLRRQRLGANVMTSLATILHRSALTRIDLHGNPLCDAGCEVLTHLARDLPHLTYLDLGACELGPNALQGLSLVVAQHKKLSVLLLGSARDDPYANRFTPASAAVLLEGCLRSRSLRQLDLSGSTFLAERVSDRHGQKRMPLSGNDRNDVDEDGTGRARSGGDDDDNDNNSNDNRGRRRRGSAFSSGSERGGTNNDDTTPRRANNKDEDNMNSGNDEYESGTAGGLLPGIAGGGSDSGATSGRRAPQPLALLESLLRTSQTLTSLKLKDVSLSAASALRLLRALRLNSTLTSLDLSHNGLPSVVTDELGRLLQERNALRHNCALQTLNLSGNALFDAGKSGSGNMNAHTGLMPFAAAASSTMMNMADTANASSGAAAFASYGNSSSALRHANGPTGTSPSYLLLAALSNDHTLSCLELDYCGIDDAALQVLCRSLMSNTSLTTLALRDNAMTLNGAVGLGRALCRHPCLTKLYLAGNCMEDEGGCAMATMLEGNESLEVLDMQRCWLGDRAIIALGVALQQNNHLRVLLLSDNHCTSNGGEAFAAFLERNTSLVRCQMRATSVQHQTMLRIAGVMDRNVEKARNAEPDALRREVIRLHFQKYKLEEAKMELEALRDKNTEVKRAAENFELQCKQDQSDCARRIRELQEQAENYTTQEERCRAQQVKMEAEYEKFVETWNKDMEAAKEKLEQETQQRMKLEEEHAALERELQSWQNDGEAREAAKRQQLQEIKADMEQWVAQRKEYHMRAEDVGHEVQALQAQVDKKKKKPAGGKPSKKSKA